MLVFRFDIMRRVLPGREHRTDVLILSGIKMRFPIDHFFNMPFILFVASFLIANVFVVVTMMHTFLFVLRFLHDRIGLLLLLIMKILVVRVELIETVICIPHLAHNVSLHFFICRFCFASNLSLKECSVSMEMVRDVHTMHIHHYLNLKYNVYASMLIGYWYKSVKNKWLATT